METENLPEQRIQNSVSEDDPGSQKKNGGNSPRQSLLSSFNPCFSTLLFYDTHKNTHTCTQLLLEHNEMVTHFSPLAPETSPK